MDSFMSCCLDTVKQSNNVLVPFSVGYDSEEETVDFSKSSYQNLLEINLRMVSELQDYCIHSISKLRFLEEDD